MKPIATGGIFMPCMKISVMLVVLFFIPTLLPAQQQVKKGRWFIGHSIGGPAYETSNFKSFDNNGALAGHTKFSGLFFNLSFTGPNWGSMNANSYQQENVLTGEEIDSRGLSITLQPTAGYFVRDNLVIGASLLLSGSSGRAEYSENDANSQNSVLGAGIGPLVRYYFGNQAKSKPFAGLESRYSIHAFKQESSATQAGTTYRGERDQDNKNLRVLPHVGYAWFPGKRWILELRLQYEYSHATVEAKELQFTNNVMNMGYPRRSRTEDTKHGVGIAAAVAFTLN